MLKAIIFLPLLCVHVSFKTLFKHEHTISVTSGAKVSLSPQLNAAWNYIHFVPTICFALNRNYPLLYLVSLSVRHYIYFYHLCMSYFQHIEISWFHTYNPTNKLAFLKSFNSFFIFLREDGINALILIRNKICIY